jgi:hypothetical protein
MQKMYSASEVINTFGCLALMTESSGSGLFYLIANKSALIDPFFVSFLSMGAADLPPCW